MFTTLRKLQLKSSTHYLLILNNFEAFSTDNHIGPPLKISYTDHQLIQYPADNRGM